MGSGLSEACNLSLDQVNVESRVLHVTRLKRYRPRIRFAPTICGRCTIHKRPSRDVILKASWRWSEP
jgi:hypothetical protein